MQALSYDEYNAKMKNLKTMSDVTNFLKELVAPTLQVMLEAEITDHVGRDKYERSPKTNQSAENAHNYRNGHSQKTIKGEFGKAIIDIPRDRAGSFTPLAVKKYETIESDVEERIVSMYGKGLTTRDIEDHMHDIYGVDVSPSMISIITDKVKPLIEEWQSRPLSSLYPVVYLDGLHCKVRDNGKIVNKCAYIALGINDEGRKDILGIWIGETEGAKFWLGILNELKNRGVDDILICCVDGLTGFSDAIHTVFPNTDIQQCIVHQIRNTMKYVPHKEKDRFCSDLRTVYTAPTEEAGLQALADMKQKWPQYQMYLKSWETKWPELSTFFIYPPEIRRIIYTTNAIENVNRQFRKVTKTTTIFPHDEAMKKLLWLAQKDITKKWTQPIPGWIAMMSQFAIMYPDRVKIF